MVFRTGKHPSPAFESGPSAPIMTGQLEEMMSHRSQLTNTDASGGGREDKQSPACEQVQAENSSDTCSFFCNLFRL